MNETFWPTATTFRNQHNWLDDGTNMQTRTYEKYRRKKKGIKLSGPIKITAKKINKHTFKLYWKPDKILTGIIENKSLSKKSKGKPGGKVRGTEGRRFRKTRDRNWKKKWEEMGVSLGKMDETGWG